MQTTSFSCGCGLLAASAGVLIHLLLWPLLFCLLLLFLFLLLLLVRHVCLPIFAKDHLPGGTAHGCLWYCCLALLLLPACLPGGMQLSCC